MKDLPHAKARTVPLRKNLSVAKDTFIVVEMTEDFFQLFTFDLGRRSDAVN